MRIEKPLEPGETLTIDGETLEVELDGTEAYGHLAGEVFDLTGGSNTIEYTDDESGRTVEIEIVFQPRYL